MLPKVQLIFFIFFALYIITTTSEDVDSLKSYNFLDMKLKIEKGATVNCTKEYVVHNRTDSWLAARKFCRSIGGDLPIVTSSKEENRLVSLLANGTPTAIWLGLHSLYKVGEWATVTGQSLAQVGYSHWYSSAATNSAQYRCAALRSDGRGLDTYNCNTARNPIICERQIY